MTQLDALVAIEIVEKVFKLKVFKSWWSLHCTKNDSIPDHYFVINRQNASEPFQDIRHFGFDKKSFTGQIFSPNTHIGDAYLIVEWFVQNFDQKKYNEFTTRVGTQWMNTSSEAAKAICQAALIAAGEK